MADCGARRRPNLTVVLGDDRARHTRTDSDDEAEREIGAWLAFAPADHGSRGTAESALGLIQWEVALRASGIDRPPSRSQFRSIWEGDGADGSHWLVVLWQSGPCLPSMPPETVELGLYRQAAAGAAATQLGNSITFDGAPYVDFANGTGEDVNGDGSVDVVLSVDNGGNCWTCSYVRVFAATPAGLREYGFEGDMLPFGLQDDDGDGRYEA